MSNGKRARSVENQKFEQDDVQKALAKVIIINELPFSVVEQDGVKQHMETSFPGFHIPSHDMISRDVAQLFTEEKSNLKSFIKTTAQRVCLTLDTWTSDQSAHYLCVTAHFIDENWNLHKKIISFTPICGDNGEEIGKVVEKCLHEWEISNVLTISTGNASSYDAAIGYLRTRLANTVLDVNFLHLRCVVDFINTMVKEFLNERDKLITRVRAAIRSVKQSPARIRKFNKCAREYGRLSGSYLYLDCPARWTSTFEMLDTAQYFGLVFYQFEKLDITYKHELVNTCGTLDFSDWEKIDSHLYNWGSMVCNEGGWRTCASALDKKWKVYQYWGDEKSNMLIYVANILDPRRKTDFIELYFINYKYKHDYTDEGEHTWKKKMEQVVGATYDMFNEYIGKIGASQQNAKFQTCCYMHYLYKDTGHRGLGMRREMGFGGNADCKTEIDIYLDEDCFKDYNGFDVLFWWRLNSGRFPILSKMAKDVLALSISAIALESAFITGGSVLNEFQSSLSPSTVEALVCTQDWLPKPKKKIKVEQGSTNLDKFMKGDMMSRTSGCR